MGSCNTNKNSLIVTTINLIWHSHPVHHGKNFKFSLALKARESSSLHTILFYSKTQTKHLIALILFEYSFPCKRIRYITPIAINTHIDCVNNSKCSVRYIFKATKQGALKVTLHHFLLCTHESTIKLKFTGDKNLQ